MNAALPHAFLPTLLPLLPICVLGLLGSVHCAGMCGGIVGALSAAPAATPAMPTMTSMPANARAPAPQAAPAPAGMAGMARTRRVIAIAAATPLRQGATLSRVLAYNAGRIASYMLAGALAGGLAGAALALTRIAALQLASYWLANLMLAALGLYLMDWWRCLARLEAAGQLLWRHVQPLVKPLLPMDSPIKAFALGGLWGWLPCGMVYSVLLTALLSGSALAGAAVMLAFGLGTLPMLLGLGLLGARLRRGMQRRGVRLACGALVLGFGLLGLYRAGHGVSLGWMDSLCLTVRPAATATGRP